MSNADNKVGNLYKPLLLRLCDIPWLGPFRIFLLFAVVTTSISFNLHAPIVTPLILSYSLGVCNYLVKLHRRLLIQLKPVLILSEDQFQEELYRLNHYRRYKFIGAALLAVPILLLVNWSSEDLQAVFRGQSPTMQLIWGAFIALVNWIVVLQILVIVVDNTLRFSRLARKQTRIELMDIGTLSPYTRMGVSTILLFIGGYTILPIAVLDSMSLLRPALLSLLVTLPAAFALMVLPIESIRLRIRASKQQEIELITRGIQGDRDALRLSRLAQEADTITTSNLILYREIVEKISEWPLDNSHLFRLITYILIPVLAWLTSSLSDRVLEIFL